MGKVKEETRRGKRKWRVGDLLADERCSPAVLDFLRGTAGSAASGGKLGQEEQAVAAAGVLRIEEEEEPGG